MSICTLSVAQFSGVVSSHGLGGVSLKLHQLDLGAPQKFLDQSRLLAAVAGLGGHHPVGRGVSHAQDPDGRADSVLWRHGFRFGILDQHGRPIDPLSVRHDSTVIRA